MVWPFGRRVRYIPQLEVTECGAAALAMVLDFHGASVPLVDVRTACGVARDGSNAARVLAAARDYGLRALGLKRELEQLTTLPLPAILHWEFNHFVVLERLSRRAAWIVDPAKGRLRVARKQLGASYTGVALVFEPSEQLVRRPRRSGSLARYFAVLAGERRAIGFVVLAALMLQLLGLLAPASVQVAIDHVIKPQRDAWLAPMVLALVVALGLRHALEWLRARVTMALETALDLTVTSAFVEHLLRLPLRFFEQRSSGDLMQRIEANNELRAISAGLIMRALDALSLIGFATLMFCYDATLACLALAVSASRLLLVSLLRGSLRQHGVNLLALAGRETSVLVEALLAPEMVRAIGAENALLTRYGARLTERLNTQQALAHTTNRLASGMLLFEGAAAATVLWVGGQGVIAGTMTVGVFSGFLLLSALVDRPLAALFGSVDTWLYARSILSRVDDVLDVAPERAGSARIAQLRGEVALEDVSFRHGPASPLLFEQLHLRVRPGEKIAIVGPSGAGKSSLLKLLVGLATPTCGRVTFDGVELARLDREALARQVGVVSQELFLLDDTVAENLRLRCPDASDEELREAARIACIAEAIDALPRGFETRLGAEGVGLSGGQKQRLAVARAVVGGPRVLVLDEATSSLDLATERALHANLSSLGCTRIVIAHRLATVEDADRILVLDRGRIVQTGTFAQLSRADGLFRALLQAGST